MRVNVRDETKKTVSVWSLKGGSLEEITSRTKQAREKTFLSSNVELGLTDLSSLP